MVVKKYNNVAGATAILELESHVIKEFYKQLKFVKKLKEFLVELEKVNK